MTVRDDLVAARALIDTPEKWARGSGRPDGKMCAMNAVAEHHNLQIGRLDHPTYVALTLALPSDWTSTNGRNSVGRYNDTHDHADVMSLFDRAIASTSDDTNTGAKNE